MAAASARSRDTTKRCLSRCVETDYSRVHYVLGSTMYNGRKTLRVFAGHWYLVIIYVILYRGR